MRTTALELLCQLASIHCDVCGNGACGNYQHDLFVLYSCHHRVQEWNYTPSPAPVSRGQTFVALIVELCFCCLFIDLNLSPSSNLPFSPSFPFSHPSHFSPSPIIRPLPISLLSLQSYQNPETPGGATYDNPATPSLPESPQSSGGTSHYGTSQFGTRTPMYAASDYMTPSPGLSPLTPSSDYSPRTPGSPMEHSKNRC